MERAEALALCDRLVAAMAGGGSELADGQLHVPVAEYLDPARWQAEVDRIFRTVPVVLAPSALLAEPNSFVTRDVLGSALVVARDGDGVARTFVNACVHRGARLCDGTGTARRLTCPYHGWTYDTAGRLVGVPHRDQFGDIATDGLLQLPTAERHGLVFAMLGATPTAGDATPPPDIDAWLDGFDAPLADLRLADQHVVAVSELAGPNWKVAKDGYFDGYHFSALHKDTLGLVYRGNAQVFEAWGPHQRFHFATHRLHDGGMAAAHEHPRPHQLMGSVTALFPNTAFAGDRDGLLMSQVFPGATPGASITFQTHLRRRPLDPADTADVDKALERVRYLEFVVQEEDYATGLAIGRNLPAMAGAAQAFVFGRNELANQRFHSWVRHFLENDSSQ
ncbi:MAG: aromatic ring-hydroxylating dioxygenase subunit alpha [Ilumatobacteraceae bacterium]